jgi:hypothetical protein
LEASEFLAISPDILRCAVLDDAGRILSYAESERGRAANLPADYLVTIKALVIEGLSEALPKELGNLRFTTVVTDKYRLVTLGLVGRTVMFALPITVSADPVCDAAIKKFGGSSSPTSASPAFRR